MYFEMIFDIWKWLFSTTAEDLTECKTEQGKKGIYFLTCISLKWGVYKMS